MTKEEKLQLLSEMRNPELRMQGLLTDKAIAEAILKIESDILIKKGDKGEDGYTPIKGEDYYTEEEISSVISLIQSKVKNGKDGERGIQGIPGTPGKNGETPIRGVDYWTIKDQEKILQEIISKIPKSKDPIIPKAEDIANQAVDILKKNPIHFKDIKGTEQLIAFLKTGGFRGGGSSSGGTTSPLTTKGDIYTFSTVNARLGVGTNGQILSADSSTVTGLKWITVSGTGTVTTVTSNDGSITVATPTTTPDLSVVSAPILTTARTIGGVSFNGSANIKVGPLSSANINATTSAELAGVISDETGSGALVFANTPTLVTPVLGVATATSINGNTITTGTGTLTLSTFTLTVAGNASISGTNTGDQTTISGNAGTATALQNTRTIWGQNFNGTANVTGDITLGTANITMTGSIAATANRVTKLWATDIESTNMYTVGGTSLASTFQGLDTQLTSLAALIYAGNAGKFIRLNAGETDFEFATVSGTGTVTSVDASGGLQTVSGSAITTTGTIRGAHIRNAQTGTTYTLDTTDRGKYVTFSNALAVAVTLPVASATFPDGWFTYVQNVGVGAVTITPTTSTINGGATLILTTNQSAIIVSDGTNYSAFIGQSSGSGGATTALDNLSAVAINASLVLGTSDAFALGSTTKQWSDLFLAEGGVINWDNGDATITQTGNDITVAGVTTFQVGTSTAFTTGTIELGAASDTTIARVGAGQISVEGVNIMTVASVDTITGAKTFSDGKLLLAGATSGATTLKAPAVAGTNINTLPTVGGSLPGLVVVTGTASSTTNSGSETNLAIVTIPGGALKQNGVIRVQVFFIATGTAGTKGYFVRASTSSGDTSGGTLYINNPTSANTTAVATVQTHIFSNNSTTAQIGAQNNTFGISATAAVTGSIDTANVWYINLNGLVANSGDTIKVQGYVVEIYNP